MSYYAIHKLGAVANPINVMLTPEEVGFVVGDCGARVLIASREKGEPLLALTGGGAAGGSEGAGGSLREIVLFGDGAPPVGSEGRSTTSSPRGARTCRSPRYRPTRSRPSATPRARPGIPKGAMHSHRNVIVNTAMTAVLHVADEGGHGGDRPPLPARLRQRGDERERALRHDPRGSFPPSNAAEVMAAIEEHRATLFEGVPTMFMYMLAHPEFDRFDLSSLTRCTVGGQTMPGSQDGGVRAARRLPAHRALGHDGDRGGPGTTTPHLRREPARLDRD